MVGYMIGIAGIMLSLLVMVLFIIGLWICKRYSFKGGFYFFLFLITHEIYSFLAPPLIRNYIDTLVVSNKDLLMGLTIAELVAFFSLIPKLLILIAFICLVYGLKRHWRMINT